MVRRWQELELTLLLAAGLCLPAHESPAQSTPPNPSVPAKAAPRQKAHPHQKKAAPDPPAAQAPAPPPTLEQRPPTPPQVTYNNGQLTIIAQNATLSQVLRSVQAQTGASIEMPSGAASERVVGQLGPGLPRDVLSALLNGLKFNYIILGVSGNPGAVQKVILTTLRPASPVNTAQNNAAPSEEPQDEENFVEPKRQPQSPVPLLIRHSRMPEMPEGFKQLQLQVQPQPDNSGETSQPNGTKTPEQLLQEQQMQQQQQQQMQEQSNPVNRQPPQ